MASFLQIALLLQLAGAPQTPTLQPGGIDGRVTNVQTGEPISGARLTLSPAIAPNGNPPPNRTITSQADGGFVLESVVPGTYFLTAQKLGFVFSNPRMVSQAISLSAGQQVSNLILQLTPQGTISGKVTDEEGTPLPGMRVEVMSTYMLRGTQQVRQSAAAVSDPQGNFRTQNLAAGKYYLAADPNRANVRRRGQEDPPEKPAPAAPDQPNYSFVRTFYPRVPDLESATPLDVSAGQELSGITIRMRRGATYAIRGRIEGLVARGQGGLPSVTLTERAGAGAATTARVQPDRTFEIAKVQPGQYTLRMLGRDEGDTSPQPNGIRQRVLARQDIDVSASDLEGVVLAVQPAINVTGRITVSGTDANVNLAQIRINVSPAENLSYTAFSAALVKPDGTFTVPGLDPGKYLVRAYGAPTGTYIKSVTFNQQDITAGEMDLSAGGSGDLEVTVRGGTGEVDGTVQSSSSATATIVILIPQSLPMDGAGLLSGRPSNGTFSVRNVPPGRYFAFALQRWDNNLWQNLDFVHALESNGASVDLEENGRTQVQLTTIPQDTIQEMATRLGLTTN